MHTVYSHTEIYMDTAHIHTNTYDCCVYTNTHRGTPPHIFCRKYSIKPCARLLFKIRKIEEIPVPQGPAPV